MCDTLFLSLFYKSQARQGSSLIYKRTVGSILTPRHRLLSRDTQELPALLAGLDSPRQAAETKTDPRLKHINNKNFLQFLVLSIPTLLLPTKPLSLPLLLPNLLQPSFFVRICLKGKFSCLLYCSIHFFCHEQLSFNDIACLKIIMKL